MVSFGPWLSATRVNEDTIAPLSTIPIAALRVDGLMAEIQLRIGDQELISVITRSSAERMGLRKGDEVFAVIKSTEVMIGTGGLE